jgi:hypothetical protein
VDGILDYRFIPVSENAMANHSATLTKLKREPRNWVTAKVIDSHRARRFINRLDSLGYEYQVVLENRHLRILVREQSLDEVLGWFGDLSQPKNFRARQSDLNSRAAVSLLIAIPAGMLVGSVFSKLVGIPGPFSHTISGYCGFAAAILVYGFVASRSNRVLQRDWQTGSSPLR